MDDVTLMDVVHCLEELTRQGPTVEFRVPFASSDGSHEVTASSQVDDDVECFFRFEAFDEADDVGVGFEDLHDSDFALDVVIVFWFQLSGDVRGRERVEAVLDLKMNIRKTKRKRAINNSKERVYSSQSTEAQSRNLITHVSLHELFSYNNSHKHMSTALTSGL